MRVRATKTVEYLVNIHHQEHDDPDDGMRAGYWAFVGDDHQSDFVVGPFGSPAAARTGAIQRLERMGYSVERKR